MPPKKELAKAPENELESTVSASIKSSKVSKEMSNSLGENFNIQKYKSMPQKERARFLHSVVEYGEPLEEGFFLDALRWEEDNTAKWYLIKGLGILKSISAISILIEICKESDVMIETQLNSSGTNLHEICAWSLGEIGSSALDPVLSLMGHKDAEVRRTAVVALGLIGDESAVGVLCDALRNEIESVKIWAALSLSKLGKVSIPCLQEVALDQIDANGSFFALDALIKIKDEAISPVIENIVETGTQVQLKYLLEFFDAWYPNYYSAKTIHNPLSEDQIKMVLLSKIKETR